MIEVYFRIDSSSIKKVLNFVFKKFEYQIIWIPDQLNTRFLKVGYQDESGIQVSSIQMLIVFVFLIDGSPNNQLLTAQKQISWLPGPQPWGQSSKDFYTLGQIYKRVLKHKNNAPTKTFVFLNVRTLLPNILIGLNSL